MGNTDFNSSQIGVKRHRFICGAATQLVLRRWRSHSQMIMVTIGHWTVQLCKGSNVHARCWTPLVRSGFPRCARLHADQYDHPAHTPFS
jgi:hypothetical protein